MKENDLNLEKHNTHVEKNINSLPKKSEEITTPHFNQNNDQHFFPEDDKSDEIYIRNNTKYSDNNDHQVGNSDANSNKTNSLFRRDMSKQSTYESGVKLPSNNGSSIRFGGSFKKNSKTSKDNKDNLYSDIRLNKEVDNSSNIMIGSNIKVNNIDSDDDDNDDPMSFLDDLLHQNNNNTKTMSQHRRRNPEMHKDAEHQLRQYYDDSPLTVVSEEASTRHTVVLGNTLSKKFSQFGLFPFDSDIQKSKTTTQGFSQFTKNSQGIFGKQPGKSAIGSKSGEELINSDFSMQRTKSALLKPIDLPRNRSNSKNLQPKSLLDLDDILEQSKNEISHDSGNLIPQNHITRVSSEGTTTIRKRTFLPDDQDNENKSGSNLFGNLKPLRQPKIDESESNFYDESEIILKNKNPTFPNNKQFDKLPDEPFSPNYQITLLGNIQNKKAIHKKKGLVENMIFKLSDQGLYYDGCLSYGKLTGNGMLLLNMVDTSDLESKEVKENLLYKGAFNDNQVNGKGILYYKNGARFVGTFRNGIAHGSGKLFRSDGDVITGIWIGGNLNI